MEILYSHCCGLDVHKNTITACSITPKGKELKTFGAMTPDLFDLAGVEEPEILASLTRGRLKSTQEQQERALLGMVGRHQRMLISTQLQHIDFLDQEIVNLDKEVEEQMRPFVKEVELLDGIPGIGVRSAQVILACIGADMSRFPTEGDTSPRGRVSLQEITRAPASARKLRPPRVIHCYAPLWFRLPSQLRMPRTVIFLLSITG